LYGVAFGADGNLYVSDNASEGTVHAPSQVLKFDGTTGGFLGTYVAAGSGGLTEAGGLAFGPDGNLYVLSYLGGGGMGQVLEYQGLSVGPNGEQPGQFLKVFCNTGMDSGPAELTFGPDSNLYVACQNFTNGGASKSGTVNRYEGPSGPSPGQFIDTFVSKGAGGVEYPRSPMFDSQGHLYVAEPQLNEVLRYEGPNEATPGAFLDTYVTSGQGGLVTALGLAIGPDGNLYVGSRDAGKMTRFAPASQATFTVTLDSPSASTVSVSYTTADGTAVAGTDYTKTFGTLTFPAGATSETVSVPISTVATGGPTKTFTLNLSNPVNATIADGVGVGSILNRQTKFFVEDSGTVKTYEYGSGGTSEEITDHDFTTDTAPRGVATTAAGTTVWVADANKNVYVYTNHGVLLGSWTPGGLNPTAQVEGVATNGTDVWLVDAKQDKVFRYAGGPGAGANRLSGSQNPASSFSLSSGDKNPKDIVTDGTSLWVVDDGSSADKVFKYTLSGSLLGSWMIDAANAHPTGITINPNNVSDVWIVDSGTLKVYQYTGAASRTSGSQNAAATFALNPNDTNPQGIADPPPADLLPRVAFVSNPADRPASISSNAAGPGAIPAVASIPSLTSPLVPWLIPGREIAPWSSNTFLNLTSGGTSTGPSSDRSAARDRMPTSGAGSSDESFGGQRMPFSATLTDGAGPDFDAADLFDGARAAAKGQVPEVATDSFFALLVERLGSAE
jgi:hypothetical protein